MKRENIYPYRPMPVRSISPERQGLYYLGMALSVLGGILFLSAFVSFMVSFGDFNSFEDRMGWQVGLGMAGMLCLLGGRLLRRLGMAGLAGSGMKLDPEQARRDLEPWARMGGGMLGDALDEAGVQTGRSDGDDLPFDEQLRRLDALRREGLLNADEYASAKQKILGGLGG